MPRPPRHLDPDSWHHVMHRGADRQDIVVDDDDRLYLEALMADLCRRSNVDIHAYVLMTNHLHLLVHANTTDTSSALQRLFGTYATHFNERHERTGPLFSGRFRSVPASSDEQVVAVGRYIHRNPLDMLPLGALAAYRWSSYPVYLQRRDCEWLTTDHLEQGQSPSSLQRFVETPLASDSTPPAGLPIRARFDVGSIVCAVAAAAGVETAFVTRGRRGGDNSARTLAAQLVVELRAAPPGEAATELGFRSTSGLRSAARRGRVAATNDLDYRLLRDRVLARLDVERSCVEGV